MIAQATARLVDEAVHDRLVAAEDTATTLLGQHRRSVETLIARLEEHETLDHDDIEAVLSEPPKAVAG